MNNKRNRTIWAISLVILGIVTVINAFSSLLGIELSDTLVRLMGIIMIVVLPVLVYSSVKVLKNGKS